MADRVEDFLGKAKANQYFRQVLITGEKTQSVVMSIEPGEDIGMEIHPKNEQVLLCIEGDGKAILNKHEMPFKAGDMVVVKSGIEHNFLNSGKVKMKIITIYSPPDHKDGTVHKTKAEAVEDEGPGI